MLEKEIKGPNKEPLTISGNDPNAERLQMRLKPSSTAALMELDAAWGADGLLKPVKVMDMAVLAALLFVLNVRDRTPLDIVGVANVADAAVAAGLLNVGDPDNVTTSLPLAGMAETGVMVMAIVTAAAPARTSGSENDGPVRPPLTIVSAVAVF